MRNDVGLFPVCQPCQSLWTLFHLSMKRIKKAIKKANKKYPNEALKLDGSEINDVASYYDYLLEHENIIHKISH